MSADQIAEIAPAIREVLEAGGGLCATFEVAGDPSSWVQFTDGTLNAAYPSDANPSSLLSILGTAAVEAWEPRTFLTVSLSEREPREIARWIDRYFEVALAAPAKYAVNVRLENL